MVNENFIPQTETVYKLKNEIPSYEEFLKNYKSDERVKASYDLESEDQALYGSQYGPSGRKKEKKFGVKWERNEHLIDTLNDRVAGVGSDLWDVDESADKNDDWRALSLETSARGSAGLGGLIASGGASASAIRYNDSGGDLRFGSASIGGEIGAGPGGVTAGYSAGVDVVNLHTTNGIRANVGLDVGSGATVGPSGFKVKLFGFGFDAGKTTGFSTPFGGASIDFEETCNQQ